MKNHGTPHTRPGPSAMFLQVVPVGHTFGFVAHGIVHVQKRGPASPANPQWVTAVKPDAQAPLAQLALRPAGAVLVASPAPLSTIAVPLLLPELDPLLLPELELLEVDPLLVPELELLTPPELELLPPPGVEPLLEPA
jgi:hypothetical protein